MPTDTLNINDSIYKTSPTISSCEILADDELDLFPNEKSRQAFTIIYKKFYPFAYFFARKFVSSEDASDIVSSIFAKILLKRKEFDSFDHVKAFLLVSIKNACLDHCRNELIRLRKENGWYYSQYQHEIECDYSREEIGTEKLARIYVEIEKLPPCCKRVFQMAYLDNLKNDEIARLLGISKFTVKTQKSYSLKILRMGLLSLLLPFLISGFSH